MTDPQFDLWAIDEVHFQQHGSRSRMWVAPETKDPVLMHEPTRRKIGYFGAVRLRDVNLSIVENQASLTQSRLVNISNNFARQAVNPAGK
jgi:hypothetical protein